MGPTISVLLVDDDERILRLYKSMLESYQLFTASDGGEALRVIGKMGVPDLVITDLNMPVLNGFGLIAELIMQEIDVPVIMATSEPVSQEHQEEIGVLVLRKPFTTQVLKDAVNKMITEPVRLKIPVD